jgi:hypothetical protein
MTTTTPAITATGAGELCNIPVGDTVLIELFRSFKYFGPRDGLTGFRPARILKNDQQVWGFKEANYPKGHYGDLLQLASGVYVIAICDRECVLNVIMVNDWANCAPLIVGDKTIMLGGSSAETRLDAKIAAAELFDMDYITTAEEDKILDSRAAARRAANKDQSTTQVAAGNSSETKLARRQARDAMIAEILARKKVEGYSENGKKLFGAPVTTDAEWQCLPDNTGVIFMKDGEPVEGFFVEKKHGGRVSKKNATPVTATKPEPKATASVANTAAPVVAQELKEVTLKSETRLIPILADMAAVKQLQVAGLDGGQWVGVVSKDGNILSVYAVSRDQIATVGQLKKKTPAATDAPAETATA